MGKDRCNQKGFSSALLILVVLFAGFLLIVGGSVIYLSESGRNGALSEEQSMESSEAPENVSEIEIDFPDEEFGELESSAASL